MELSTMIFTKILSISPSIKKIRLYFCINIMHHPAFHSLKSKSHTNFLFQREKGQLVSKGGPTCHLQVNPYSLHSGKRKEEDGLS